MNAQRGFTLVEVMVALLVISVGYASVITALSGFADQRLMLRERIPAHQVAWNLAVASLLAARGWSGAAAQAQQQDGQIDHAGQDWRWLQQSTRARGEGLYRYDFSVSRADARPAEPSAAALYVFIQR